MVNLTQLREKLWQVKSKQKIKRAKKKEFEEHLANDASSESKILFKYKKKRKLARKLVGLLDDYGVKGALRSDKARAEKLDKFFVLVLTVKDHGEVPLLNLFFIAHQSEELPLF